MEKQKRTAAAAASGSSKGRKDEPWLAPGIVVKVSLATQPMLSVTSNRLLLLIRSYAYTVETAGCGNSMVHVSAVYVVMSRMLQCWC